MRHLKFWWRVIPVLSTIGFVILASGNLLNVNRPLIYTKLRHDNDFLQIYRRYQLYETYNEKKITLKVNETVPNSNSARQIELEYYENPHVDAANVTLDDLILESIDRMYLTRLMPANVHEFTNPEDRKRASDKSLISPAKCERELQYLLDKMHQIKSSSNGKMAISPELASFFDTSASVEPGVLLGNNHWVGPWRECRGRRIFDIDMSDTSNYYDFRGRYCVASIRSPSWDAQIKDKAAQLDRSHFKYDDQKYDYARFFRIQVGVCLPESCDSQSINSKGIEIRRLVMSKLSQPYTSYNLVDLYCLPDDGSELRQFNLSAWIFILLLSGWLSLILFATYCDYNSEPSKTCRALTNWEKVVKATSMIQNWKRLWETGLLEAKKGSTDGESGKKDDLGCKLGSDLAGAGGSTGLRTQLVNERNKLSPRNLDFLNFFKVIGMVGILFGHAGMILKHVDKYALDYQGIDKGFVFHFNASTVFYVDWFFCISGFLIAYLAFSTKRVERNTVAQWCYAIFHRYWRLAPMYIIIFWFSKSLFHHFGSGPNWDYGTSNVTIRGICQRESWIYPLTLTSNWHPIHDECIMPTWYISSDMQFYLITPFLLVLLSKSPVGGWLSISAMIFASFVAGLYKWTTDPRVQHLELARPMYDLYMRNNWDIHPTYVFPQYRIPSYLIGILTGHYVFMVLSGKWTSSFYDKPSVGNLQDVSSIRKSKLRARSTVFWLGIQVTLCMTIATWLIAGLYPTALEPKAKYYISLLYASSHTGTSVAVGVVLAAIMFGHAPAFRRFISKPVWTVISRMNFFVYLVQVNVIYFLTGSGDSLPVTSCNTLVRLWISVTGVSYALSAVLTMLLELPFAQLERLFIGEFVRQKTSNRMPNFQGADNSHRKDGREGKKKPQPCELSPVADSSKLIEKQQTKGASIGNNKSCGDLDATVEDRTE